MGEEYKKQHFVPQRYLKRFGRPNSNNDGYNIGVLRKTKEGHLHHFRQAVDNIAYENNLYDVSGLDDSKYWEHHYSNEIEPFYGNTLDNILSKIMLSNHEKYLLSFDERHILSKLLISQFARVPAFLKPNLAKGPKICKETKNELLEKYRTILNEEQKKKILEFQPEPGFIKNVTLGIISDDGNLEYFASIVDQGIFLILYNDTDIPFLTSDNPVILYNYMSKSMSYKDNGVGNMNTIIYYPLSPRVLLQVVPRGFRIGDMNAIDGSLHVLKSNYKDINYIAHVNDFQIEHASAEIYITIEMLELLD